MNIMLKNLLNLILKYKWQQVKQTCLMLEK
jgi:hypothetical protein